MTEDSPEYQRKKAFFDSILTIYGRKAVLEALQDPQLAIYKLHLAESNREGGIVAEIIELAERRNIPIDRHDRKALSRLSRNSKQDQGVVADIQLDRHQSISQFLARADGPPNLIALDGISNPQNLGMIVRSIAAGNCDGLILPRKGCAALSPLAIKASVGTVFKACIIHCDTLDQALREIKQVLPETQIVTLSSHAKLSLFDFDPRQHGAVYVLGNETEGVSKTVQQLSDQALCIPMNNGVESLNVAITAALIAFKN